MGLGAQITNTSMSFLPRLTRKSYSVVNHSGSDLSLGSTVLKDEGKTLSLLGREALGVVHGGLVVGVLL